MPCRSIPAHAHCSNPTQPTVPIGRLAASSWQLAAGRPGRLEVQNDPSLEYIEYIRFFISIHWVAKELPNSRAQKLDGAARRNYKQSAPQA